MLGQDTARQFAMVDHADMRGLVTDWTSLHRGAGLSLIAGFIDRERPIGDYPVGRCRYSPNKGSPHRPDHALTQRACYRLYLLC